MFNINKCFSDECSSLLFFFFILEFFCSELFGREKFTVASGLFVICTEQSVNPMCDRVFLSLFYIVEISQAAG